VVFSEAKDIMATKVRLTADDLWRMPDDDIRRELVNGEIVEMPPANVVHGYYVLRLGRLLEEHVRESKSGIVVAGDVGFRLALPNDPERVRAPDVCFISSQRLHNEGFSEKFFPGAPDLAVEILSPSESSSEIQQKVRDYLEAGSRLVWLVSPRSKTVAVFRADGSAQFLNEKDTLTGEPVLPGLSISLGEFFSDPAF
jgi:Uma2 family endonuclease